MKAGSAMALPFLLYFSIIGFSLQRILCNHKYTKMVFLTYGVGYGRPMENRLGKQEPLREGMR